MIKKTITYVDYNGKERTDDFYFNLSKAELLEMELSAEGGLTEVGKRMIEGQDIPGSIKIFKDLILKSYGRKSADGRRFIKSEELSDEFSQTEAYSELFVELATDEKAASEFFNGVIPEALKGKMAEPLAPAEN